MKFTIEKSELLSAIATAARALPPRAAAPVLEGVLLEAQEDKSRLKLVCTDTALQIETYVPAQVTLRGVLVLPGKLFYEVVRRLPEGEVEISARSDKPNSIVVRSGKSKTSMQGYSADEFPEMPAVAEMGRFSLPQKSLRSMIAQTQFAISSDESRPVLTGGLFEIKEGLLNVVGLDGYRLAVRSEPCFCEGDRSAVVPSGSLSAIERVLGDEGDVTVTLSQNAALFDVGHTRVTTVLLSGDYMQYRRIIPQDRLTVVQIERAELMAAIDRASLMARDSKNNLVRFSVAGDMLTVSSNSELGDVTDEVPMHLTGGELDIAFNAKFMTDVLKVLSDDEVLLEMNTPVTPCVIRPLSGDAWIYLVLPVRVFN